MGGIGRFMGVYGYTWVIGSDPGPWFWTLCICVSIWDWELGSFEATKKRGDVKGKEKKRTVRKGDGWGWGTRTGTRDEERR